MKLLLALEGRWESLVIDGIFTYFGHRMSSSEVFLGIGLLWSMPIVYYRRIFVRYRPNWKLPFHPHTYTLPFYDRTADDSSI